MNKLLATLTLAAAFALPTLPSFAHGDDVPAAKGARVTLVYQQELPNVPGKSLKGVLVEYEPGGFNPSHTHARSAVIYATVLEGEVTSQVNGGPIRTYKAGENFTEMPGDFHDISANASKTSPAKLLAVFVVDTDDQVLTTPAKPR